MVRSPKPLVQGLGAAFAVEGFVGLIHPEAFRELVVWLQSPPAWPWSVVLRAVIGLVLLAVASPARSAGTVRAVGILTLVGAGVGLLCTDLDQAPHGSIWRLPSLVLSVAGLAVVWGVGKTRPAA